MPTKLYSCWRSLSCKDDVEKRELGKFTETCWSWVPPLTLEQTPAHVHYAGYTYSQLYPLISLMVECCEIPRKHHAAIYEKYTDKRFKRASLFVEAEMRKGFHLPEVTREKSLCNPPSLDAGHQWKRA